MSEKPPQNKNIAYLCLGYFLFALGFVGIFLPALPTILFWIGAVWCFARSSQKMYDKIISWPKIGPQIKDYLDHGVISRKGKIFACGSMILISIYLIAAPIDYLINTIALSCLAVGFFYVVSRPSYRD